MAVERLLLVEDADMQALLIEHQLAKGGFTGTIHRAKSLADAIAFAPEQTIDLCILDLSLPDSHGVSTVTALRQRFPDTPVVVVTAEDEVDVALACLEQGADEYLVKADIAPRLLWRTLQLATKRRPARETSKAICCTMVPRNRWTAPERIAQLLRAGKSVVWVGLNRGHAEMLNRLQEMDVPTSNLAVIDGTSRSNAVSFAPKSVYVLDSPAALEQSILRIEHAITRLGGKATIVVDSLDMLRNYISLDQTREYVHYLANILRLSENEADLLITDNPGGRELAAHAESIVDAIQ